MNNEKYESDLLIIRDIAALMEREPGPHELLEKTISVLEKRAGFLRGMFTLREGDNLVVDASPDLQETERNRGRYQIGEGITGIAAEKGVPEIVPDIRADSRFLNRTGRHEYGGKDEQVAFICVPIIHGGSVVGTISADRIVGPETDLERDSALLQTVGSLAAGILAVRRVEKNAREHLLEENRRLRDILAGTPGDIIGNCDQMQAVARLVRQVAPTDATVLIRGATGTGKELVARAIVALSGRSNKPFVALNCAALPEALVESELFGHEKGAFTGAVQRRIGRAEEADGGTLFLDEIGDLTPQTQVKILRFLQERTFSRVGSNVVLKSNVRFIAATSRNLEELMAQGKFREDLFYRLNIFPIRLPALKDRKSDVVLLAEHFLERANVKYGKKIRRISTPAVNMLLAYTWPGNVRELENCMEHAVLIATDDSIHAYNLPPSLQTADSSAGPERVEKGGNYSYDAMIDSYGRELIVEALKRNRGNQSAAGRDLGLSPRVMNYKMHRLGISSEWYVKS